MLQSIMQSLYENGIYLKLETVNECSKFNDIIGSDLINLDFAEEVIDNGDFVAISFGDRLTDPEPEMSIYYTLTDIDNFIEFDRFNALIGNTNDEVAEDDPKSMFDNTIQFLYENDTYLKITKLEDCTKFNEIIGSDLINLKYAEQALGVDQPINIDFGDKQFKPRPEITVFYEPICLDKFIEFDEFLNKIGK